MVYSRTVVVVNRSRNDREIKLMSPVVQQRRKWSYALMIALVVLGMAMMGAVPAAAATFTVNSTDDDGDISGADGVCDAQPGPAVKCTLRAAVEQSNFTGPNDTIVFQANLGPIFVEDDIDIGDSVRIIGKCDRKQVINGFESDNGIFEIFGGVITFECLKLEDGDDDTGDGGCIDIDPGVTSVAVRKVEFINCQAQNGNGGAIDNGSDLLRVENSKFIDNFADNDGGGIYTGADGRGVARTLVSKNTLFKFNRAGDDGGAMASQEEDSHQNVTNTRFIGNEADDLGGAVAHQGDSDSTTRIDDSVFRNNQANRGGAFCDVSGDGDVDVDVFDSNVFQGNFSVVNPPFENNFCIPGT
jgi:predicted outer membrane repeat protein